MESGRLPMNGARFSLDGGSADVWNPGRGVIVARLVGYGHAAFAPPEPALGGIVKSHAEDEPFRNAIESELRERRVVGFSPDVLGARQAAAR